MKGNHAACLLADGEGSGSTARGLRVLGTACHTTWVQPPQITSDGCVCTGNRQDRSLHPASTNSLPQPNRVLVSYCFHQTPLPCSSARYRWCVLVLPVAPRFSHPSNKVFLIKRCRSSASEGLLCFGGRESRPRQCYREQRSSQPSSSSAVALPGSCCFTANCSQGRWLLPGVCELSASAPQACTQLFPPQLSLLGCPVLTPLAGPGTVPMLRVA